MRRVEGLTLAELVMCGGMLVLVLAAAVPLWQTGLGMWERESEMLALRQEQRIVTELLFREIRRAQRDGVEIVLDSGTGHPALQFILDEGQNRRVIVSYLQDQKKLIKRTDKGEGPGTNVYFTELTPENGFSFAFVDPQTGSRNTAIGSRLLEYEVIELVLHCGNNQRSYKTLTQVVPRN